MAQCLNIARKKSGDDIYTPLALNLKGKIDLFVIYLETDSKIHIAFHFDEINANPKPKFVKAMFLIKWILQQERMDHNSISNVIFKIKKK